MLLQQDLDKFYLHFRFIYFTDTATYFNDIGINGTAKLWYK